MVFVVGKETRGAEESSTAPMNLSKLAKSAEKAIHLLGRGMALYISLIYAAAFGYAVYLLIRDIIGLPPVH
jgi:hypothetical protein